MSNKQTFVEGSSSEISLWITGGGEKDRLPNAFHTGRKFALQKRDIELTLFDGLREKAENDTSLAITGFPKGISRITMGRVNMALSQCLYNTSYREGNINKLRKENTGLAKDGKLIGGTYMPPVELSGEQYNYGEIVVGLSELTSLAFGLTDKPTNRQKQEVEQTLKAYQNQGVTMTFPNGDVATKSLVWIKETFTQKSTGAKYMDILLSPILCTELGGFAAHPQDVMLRLSSSGRVTEEKLDLLNMLSLQDKRKPYKIYKSTLLQELGMFDEYKKQGKIRTEKKLCDTFQTMRDIKLLLPNSPNGGSNPEEVTAANGELEYIFHFNPDYIEKDKRRGAETEQN